MTYPKRIPNYKAIDDAFGEKKEPPVEPPKDPAAPSEKPKDPPASGDAPEIHITVPIDQSLEKIKKHRESRKPKEPRKEIPHGDTKSDDPRRRERRPDPSDARKRKRSGFSLPIDWLG